MNADWSDFDIETARRELLADLQRVRLERAGRTVADALNEAAKNRLRSAARRVPARAAGLRETPEERFSRNREGQLRYDAARRNRR